MSSHVLRTGRPTLAAAAGCIALLSAASLLHMHAAAAADCAPEAKQYYQKGTQVSGKYTSQGAPCADGCLEEKLYFYQHAVSLCETYANAHNNLADVYEKLGRYPDAIRHYSRAIELDPKLAVAHFGLGDVFFHTAQYDKAVQAYDRGLVLHPEDALATKNRALALRLREGKQANAGIIESALGGSDIKTMGPAGIRPNLRIPLYIPFAFDSDALLPAAQGSLNELGSALQSILAASPSAAFMIEGHTDVRGTDEYNLSLSKRRGQMVVQALAEKFKIPKDRLGLAGYGKTRPFSLGASEADHARNRRVEVVRLEAKELEWMKDNGAADAVDPAAREPRALSVDAAVFYQDSQSRSRKLQDGAVLQSGAPYRVYFQPDQPCYVYIFQVDTSGKLFHLFPNPDYGYRDNHVQAQKANWVPGRDQWFELDRTSGEEAIYVVATLEPREDIEDLFARYGEGQNSPPKEKAVQELSIVLKTMGVKRVGAGASINPAPGTGRTAEVVVDRLVRDGVSLAHKFSFQHK